MGKENYELKKTVAILSNFLSIIRLYISAQKNGVRGLRLNFIIRIDKYEPCRVHNLAMQFIWIFGMIFDQYFDIFAHKPNK